MKLTTPVLFVAVFTLLGWGGCREGEAHAGSPTAESKRASGESSVEKPPGAALSEAARLRSRAVNVKVQELSRSSLTEYVLAHGVTRALRDVTYSAEIPGKIEYLSVDLGDKVKKGQVLARIDFVTLKAQADQAEASYNLARSTFERLGSLKDEELVSQQRLDEARSSMLSAKAQLAIARANLDKAVVRSSHAGIVGAKFVEKSEYVGPGTPMLMVVDYRTVIVEAQLAETQVASIARKARVEVDIDALEKSFEGTVDAIIPTADKASKTFTLRVKIKNPDLKILIGMSATVRVAARAHEDAIVAAQSAVIEEQDGRSVFVAEGGVARKRKVKLGAIDGDRVVLAQGVAEGEKLIVLGQRDLTDGQPIHVVQ